MSSDIFSSSDQEILNSLLKGDMKVFDLIYNRHRAEFLKFSGQKYHGLSQDNLIDAWQESLISFYEQVRDKRLTTLTCSLKSYLFMMGLRFLAKVHKKAARIDPLNDLNVDLGHHEEIIYHELDERQQLVLSHVSELPEQAKKILLLRFEDGLSIPEITKVLGYSSVNSVSVSLSRTLKLLKERVINSYKA